MDSSFNLDRIWAKTTDTMTSWVSGLNVDDVGNVAKDFYLCADESESELRWRVVRCHQYGRGMNVTWDGEEDFGWVAITRINLDFAWTI